MAYRTIAKDVSATIYDGGAFPGPANWINATAIKGFCTKIGVDEQVETVDLGTAFGDVRKKFRPVVGESTITVELQVPSTGFIGIALGNFIKIIIYPASTWSVPMTFMGVLSGNAWDADQAQSQKLTIKCDAEGVV